MNDNLNSAFMDDSEFQSLMIDCMETLQRGESIDRDALREKFPKYADELDRYLDVLNVLDHFAGGLQQLGSSSGPVSPYGATVTPSSTNSDFDSGDTIRYIGEYAVLEEIARGGMGVVFKARQQTLKRIVALKMILSGRLADDAEVDRFQREAQAASRLKHPNIVPVHEIGEHEGRHYFTMDFVPGRSLAEEIRDESLAPRRAAKLVKTVAEAVHFAHQAGTLHRDLKPANILLTSDDAPHVTDFGLAKILDEVDDTSRAELTASGQILGTPSYMSPEQAAGKQNLVGPASDIYSLGAILYSSLTGRAPFVADSPVDTLMQVMHNEPVSPRQLNPTVPQDLDTICLKCLNKEPHKRYGTAGELAADLQRFLEGRPVLARPIGRMARTVRWAKRNPVVASLMSLVAISLVVGTTISSYFAIEANNRAISEQKAKERQAELRIEAEERKNEALIAVTDANKSQAEMLREMQRADQKAETAEKERAIADDQLEKAAWLAYGMKISSAKGLWEAGESRLAWSNLASTDPARRGWEYGHLRHEFQKNQEVLLHDGGDFKLLAYDQAGDRLASVEPFTLSTDDDDLYVWDSKTLEKRFHTEVKNINVKCLAISPDGTRVAVGGTFWREKKENFRVWNLETGKLEFSGLTPVNPVQQIAFRSDGQELVTYARGNKNSELTVWDIPNGQELRKLSDAELKGVHVQLSRTGSAYGVRRDAKSATVTNLFDDRTLGEWKVWDREIEALSLSHDETILAVIHRDQLVSVLSLDANQDAEPHSDLFGLDVNFRYACQISPDKKYLILYHSIGKNASHELGPGVVVKVCDLQTGQTIAQHQGHRDYTMSLAVHPVQQTFVSSAADNTLLRWPISPPIQKTMKPCESIETVQFSPDGKLLAVSGKEIQIWDANTREMLFQLEDHSLGLSLIYPDVAFNHDGSLFAVTDSQFVYLYHTHNGELFWKTPKFPGYATSIQFSPDGKRLYCGGTVGILRIYDIPNRQLISELKDPRDNSFSPTTINSISIEPETQLAATAMEGGDVLVWNLATEELQQRIHHRRRENTRYLTAERVSFSPNGQLLAAAYHRGKSPDARIWNTNDWSERCELEGHSGATHDVAFHPDGNRVATASYDRTVKIWDVDTGQNLLTLSGAHWMTAVDFSPDGRRLAAGGFSGELHIWDFTDFTQPENETDVDKSPSSEKAVRTLEPRVFSIELRSHLNGILREVRFEETPIALNSGTASIAGELERRLQSAIGELEKELPVGLRIWADPYLEYGYLREVIEKCHPYVSCQTPVIRAGPSPARAPFQDSPHMYDSLIVTIGGNVDDQYCLLRPGNPIEGGGWYYSEDSPFREPALVEVSLTPSGEVQVLADGESLGEFPGSVTALNELTKDYAHRWATTLARKSGRMRNGTRLRIAPEVPVAAAMSVYRSLRVYWQEPLGAWGKAGNDIVLPMFEHDDWPPLAAESSQPTASDDEQNE